MSPQVEPDSLATLRRTLPLIFENGHFFGFTEPGSFSYRPASAGPQESTCLTPNTAWRLIVHLRSIIKNWPVQPYSLYYTGGDLSMS